MGQFGQTTEEFEYVRHNTTCHLHCTFTVFLSQAHELLYMGPILSLYHIRLLNSVV